MAHLGTLPGCVRLTFPIPHFLCFAAFRAYRARIPSLLLIQVELRCNVRHRIEHTRLLAYLSRIRSQFALQAVHRQDDHLCLGQLVSNLLLENSPGTYVTVTRVRGDFNLGVSLLLKGIISLNSAIIFYHISW